MAEYPDIVRGQIYFGATLIGPTIWLREVLAELLVFGNGSSLFGLGNGNGVFSARIFPWL